MIAPALTRLYLQVAGRVDGARIVESAFRARALPPPGAHVLAIGKVAAPMWEGLGRSMRTPPRRALLVVPEGSAPATEQAWGELTPIEVLISDHPRPTARSATAARAVQRFVSTLLPHDHLTVLLSGGASALVAAPAAALTLEEKTAAVDLLMRNGATIGELNTVRKHLSSIKGGQLATTCPAPITVFALSDVVGNDPSTIASGPFTPDPTTYAQALAILDRLAAQAPTAVRARLVRGAAGELPETPKPGNPRFRNVAYETLAGPERLAEEALAALARAGIGSDVLGLNTQASVHELATAYGQRARGELVTAGPPRVWVGTGEPRIVITGPGRGGRATHLALLVAKEIAGLRGVAFLAAGTDQYDGSAEAAGAVVNGDTWSRAADAGHDPQAALDRCDSAPLLEAIGGLVRGPGRSNLLDLHLLGIAPSGEVSLALPLFADGRATD